MCFQMLRWHLVEIGTHSHPADCKAPEMALVITALSSDELNCRAVGGGDVDLGSVRRFFADSTVAAVLEA